MSWTGKTYKILVVLISLLTMFALWYDDESLNLCAVTTSITKTRMSICYMPRYWLRTSDCLFWTYHDLQQYSPPPPPPLLRFCHFCWYPLLKSKQNLHSLLNTTWLTAHVLCRAIESESWMTVVEQETILNHQYKNTNSEAKFLDRKQGLLLKTLLVNRCRYLTNDSQNSFVHL